MCLSLCLFYLYQGQGHGHSHYAGPERYSTANGDTEEGLREKHKQLNGEAGVLGLAKAGDAGEGELMLSPAQTPQV